MAELSELFAGQLSVGMALILFASLFIAFGFEFINGFHDTANAVATVIYTRALRPWQAVIWSGLCNFLGVLVGGIAVAFAIVHLLPVDALVGMGKVGGLIMVLSILIASVIWNFGTWYLGLPASSSHTLIGAIMGVGLASSAYMGYPLGSGVNWQKALSILQSLLFSPFFGFCLAGLLLLGAKRYIKSEKIHEPPVGNTPPPLWIRAILILTCTGVSFAHGSNDGQKGIGLIMLILIGILPGVYALDSSFDRPQIEETITAINNLEKVLTKHHDDLPSDTRLPQEDRYDPDEDYLFANEDRAWEHIELALNPIRPTAGPIINHLELIRNKIKDLQSLHDIPVDDRWLFRTELLQLRQALVEFSDIHRSFLAKSEGAAINDAREQLLRMTEYAPRWVLAGVALALGIGTTVGWKRIVVTVGEKIGKTHLTYVQGACAELVAMSTIGAADIMGLPVSTTHVLSSGVAGTMAANKSGLQVATVRNIALAWIFTLPAAMLLSSGIFAIVALILRPTGG